MASKVRYITLSRVAIELVSSLPDAENALFNKILFSLFKQLENGQKPDIPETENPILNIALREAAEELETGYKTYVQRINARKKETDNQRSITDQSPINQRPTIEKNREEKKREEKEQIYDTVNPKGIDQSQRAEIEQRLKAVGIETVDNGFWNTCFVHGYDAVDAAISKAESTGDGNLKWITGMIANGYDY